jgi:hypothetical protein
MSSSAFGRGYRDPYAEPVLAQLVPDRDAIGLTAREYELLLVSVRARILTSPEIRGILRGHVKETLAGLRPPRPDPGGPTHGDTGPATPPARRRGCLLGWLFDIRMHRP